jgi:hypothetical protein
MPRGLLTKPWAYSTNDLSGAHSIAVLTCDMECAECHACGIVIVDAERNELRICDCVAVESQEVR